MIRELPIAFSDEMTQAVREDRKFMTRRTIKAGFDAQHAKFDCIEEYANLSIGLQAYFSFTDSTKAGLYGVKCPYGKPGDILYVRETYYQYGHWEIVAGVKTAGGKQKWQFVPDGEDVRYSENPPKEYRKGRHRKDPATPAWHKRLARFMPKKYSRVRLKVKEIRVERLRDITPEDAIAEGILSYKDGYGRIRYKDYVADASGYGDPLYDYPSVGMPICSFNTLWEKINGPDSLNDNPWLWVVCFDKINDLCL